MYAFSISTVNQLQTIQTSSVAYSFKKFFISKKAQTVTDDPVFLQFSSVQLWVFPSCMNWTLKHQTGLIRMRPTVTVAYLLDGKTSCNAKHFSGKVMNPIYRTCSFKPWNTGVAAVRKRKKLQCCPMLT